MYQQENILVVRLSNPLVLTDRYFKTSTNNTTSTEHENSSVSNYGKTRIHIYTELTIMALITLYSHIFAVSFNIWILIKSEN